MKITVITPTWNQGCFIKDTMESVLNQTHRDIEYIVVDNLSDDETQSVVNSFTEKDDRIIYIREADKGQAEAINKGLNRATGDIVCWINSDDCFFDENVLARVNELFEKNKNIDIIAGDGWYADKDLNKTRLEECGRLAEKGDIKKWYYIIQPSVFWRKNDLRLNEEFHYVFDWMFFAEMFIKNSVMYSGEPYSIYRMYEDNKTGMNNAKRKKEIWYLKDRMKSGAFDVSWCRYVYKKYEKAEKTGNDGIKRRVDFLNKILFHISGRKICSF